MVSGQLEVFGELHEVSDAAARFVMECARRAIAERGRFVVALAGGSTPRRLCQLLADRPGREAIEWDRWHFFLGDERVLPPTDPDCNFVMAAETLLGRVPVAPEQIHRPPTELGDAAAVAAAYERELRDFFGLAPGEVPRFDLILLGLGSDGHTASLFPGKPALDETERLVVDTPPGVLPPQVDRVTFTFPVINAARAVAFLVAGADKAAALRAAREGTALDEVVQVPAARVRPTDGELRWFVDAAAAGDGNGRREGLAIARP